MKFSQKLEHMLKNVHTKFQLDWMISRSIRTKGRIDPKVGPDLQISAVRAPSHARTRSPLNLGEISASYTYK